MPTDASTSATAAKTPIRTTESRRGAIESEATFLERADVRRRQIGIEPADLASNRFSERTRILFAPHRENHPAIRVLRMRQIILRLRFVIEAVMAHVADRAHDRDPLWVRFSRIVEGDFLADLLPDSETISWRRPD